MVSSHLISTAAISIKRPGLTRPGARIAAGRPGLQVSLPKRLRVQETCRSLWPTALRDPSLCINAAVSARS